MINKDVKQSILDLINRRSQVYIPKKQSDPVAVTAPEIRFDIRYRFGMEKAVNRAEITSTSQFSAIKELREQNKDKKKKLVILGVYKLIEE